jgi:hypothetical protein
MSDGIQRVLWRFAGEQPGMSMSRGISKGFRIVAPFGSFLWVPKLVPPGQMP